MPFDCVAPAIRHLFLKSKILAKMAVKNKTIFDTYAFGDQYLSLQACLSAAFVLQHSMLWPRSDMYSTVYSTVPVLPASQQIIPVACSEWRLLEDLSSL